MRNKYIFMASEAAKDPELTHGPVGKGRVLEHSLDLLDGNNIVLIHVPHSLED